MTDEPTCTTLTLSLDAAVLPGWFDIVKTIAATHVNRMMVIEKPEAWIVRIEIAPERSAAFQDALAAAWERFAEQRRAEGAWEEEHEA